jgi:hypothetical protein
MPVDTSIYSGLLAPPPSVADYAEKYNNLGLLPLKRQLMESQVQDAQSNNLLRSVQAQVAQRNQKMIEDYYNSGQSQSASAPSPFAGPQSQLTAAHAAGLLNGPTMEAASLPQAAPAPVAAPPQPFGGLPRDVALPDLLFNGGKGIAGFLNDRTKPTPEQLNAQYAFPGDPNAAHAAVAAQVKKSGIVPPIQARAGSTLFDPVSGKPIFYNPHIPEGYNPTFDASGNVVGVQQISGAPQAYATMAQAGTLGKGLGEIRPGFDENNLPIFSTGAPAGIRVGAGSLLGADGAPVPNAAGRPSVAPQAQAAMDGDARTILNQELVKSTQALLAATQSGDTAGAARARGDIDALHKELAMRGFNAPPSAAVLPSQQPAPIVRPSLPAGQAEYANTTGKASADRFNNIVTQASDSPTRVNVLDNIINLSKAGVATGPTQEFQNAIQGYLGDALHIPSFQSNVSKWQEANKFLQQNAIRAWSAAGGTGTDAQLAQSLTANPNSKMFPEAVQAMAQWAKAGETALQSKAAALQAANPTTPQAQTDFENKWRSAFDPRAFQLLNMAPQEQAAFIKKQPDASTLKAKIIQLHQLGAF